MPKGQLKAFKWVMPLLRLEENNEPGFGLSLLVSPARPEFSVSFSANFVSHSSLLA